MARNPPKVPAGSKMPRLPSDAKVIKRPLMHAPIPSPRRGRETQKVIYVSSKTPVMAKVTQIRKIFEQVMKRAMQSDLSAARPSTVRRRDPESSNDSPAAEKVLVKATGKAIEKAVRLADILQQQSDLVVKIGTSTVQAIDDIEAGDNAGDEPEETRVRDLSGLEIIVCLKD